MKLTWDEKQNGDQYPRDNHVEKMNEENLFSAALIKKVSKTVMIDCISV